MSPLHRFAALLVFPLALQQALAAKGIVCVEQAAAVAADAGTEMPGMNMSATTEKRGPTRGPCDKPFGPGDCQPLAFCGGTVVLPTVVSIAASNEVKPTQAACLVVLPPTSRTTAPEPPPPRI